jgi:hypothetical protein
MRDAVEHLRRIDLLEALPLRVPRNELMAAFFVIAVAVIVGVSPNPWLLRARASNPTITIAREQAQRVQRVADSLPTDSSEIDALRQLVSNGARTMDARANEPDAALNALQDLEAQVQQMSAGDDRLAAALAAMASALAGNQSTQALSDAINTGDMRQISQAAKDLAQTIASLSPEQRQQVAQALQDAASRAGRVSPSVANQLSSAADGLQAAAAATADPSQQADQAGAQAASNALNQLANSASAADARQRTASQLESSRNALERALGMTQSRTGNSTTTSTSGNASNSASSSQGASADQSGAQGQDGSGQGQSGQNGSDAGGGGSQSNDGGSSTDGSGQGGGYSTGGDPNSVNTGGSPSQLDAIFDPQQVPTNSGASPNESSINPYTSAAGSGNAQAAPESVQPNYSNKPTQGNDSGSIPLGLRDLVKDYFSSLDQK